MPADNATQHESTTATMGALEIYAGMCKSEITDRWKNFDRRDLSLLTFAGWASAETLSSELCQSFSLVGVGRAVGGTCAAIGLRKTTRVTLSGNVVIAEAAPSGAVQNKSSSLCSSNAGHPLRKL